MKLRAKPGCCEEAAMGIPFYAPCNKRAVVTVRWKGRTDPPVLMCEGCADHNVKNRGGEIVGRPDVQPDPLAAKLIAAVATALEIHGDHYFDG